MFRATNARVGHRVALCAMAVWMHGCPQTPSPNRGPDASEKQGPTKPPERVDEEPPTDRTVPPRTTSTSGKWFPREGYVAKPEFGRALKVVRDAIAAKHTGPTIDYQYSVSSDKGRYSVFVVYVHGYRDDGEAVGKAGGHTIFMVSREYELEDIWGGM